MQGLKLRETNLRRIVEESVKALRKPDCVQLEVLDNLADATVFLDHERLVKALVDLEINAIEAMPQGGCLRILVEEQGDRVCITVCDTGHGITKEHLDQLFTPFFTTKPIGEGTGLSLPSVYGVVKAHGGDLTVKSNADPAEGPTGTRIRLSLPRRLILKDPERTLILHEEA